MSSKGFITMENASSGLSNLGKPTKRGVRKCPKCGVKNGTRGLTCKNKTCEHVFKEGNKKKTSNIVAVKIVTEPSIQLYSVRQRERGPDYRGFVQLPVVQDAHGNPAENVDPSLLETVLSGTAKCYVESCPRAKHLLLSKTTPLCIHIKAAIECTTTAQLLRMMPLDSLSMNDATRRAISELVALNSSPLVQRVSRNVIVVKCKPTAKKPLGFLHTFFPNTQKTIESSQANYGFLCSCKEFKSSANVNTAWKQKRCVHFYACISSFVSDDELTKEFEAYISMDDEPPKGLSESELPPTDELHQVAQNQIFNDNGVHDFMSREETGAETLIVETFDPQHELNVINQSDIITSHSDDDVMTTLAQAIPQIAGVSDSFSAGEIDVTAVTSHHHQQHMISQQHDDIMTSDVIAQSHDVIRSDTETFTAKDTAGETVEIVLQDADDYYGLSSDASSSQPPVKRLKMGDHSILLVSDTLPQAGEGGNESVTLDDCAFDSELSHQASAVGHISATARKTAQRHVPRKTNSGAATEENVHFSFLQWLSSVTERINETMHYQFPGSPEPLVFHAPQSFFDRLQARISVGKKKRLPNQTTSFYRKDALPLGIFTKYTWYITNVLHVKQIFDTQESTIDVTRNYVQNQDSSYTFIEKQALEKQYASHDGKNLLIRPFGLNTYLKVGHTVPDQKEPTPFIIEWIPDILPRSRIGELRLKFEYGHLRNGHRDIRAVNS